jgi:hypothetical protein
VLLSLGHNQINAVNLLALAVVCTKIAAVRAGYLKDKAGLDVYHINLDPKAF